MVMREGNVNWPRRGEKEATTSDGAERKGDNGAKLGGRNWKSGV